MDIGTLTGALTIEDLVTSRLRSVTAEVSRFVDKFGGAMATAAFGATTLTAAVVGTAVSIVKLGEKGSTILGVEEAFNKLSIAVGSTGEAMIGALTEGVRGTVDSMELMQGTTRLLSSGLKISADDMRLLGSTAREMGKATGTDAASGLNILSNAMLTGNARALKRYGIQIDLISAEKQFRASLGGTTAELTAAGKLEVNRIAVLEGMRQKLDRLGESQLSFKERVQQATVSVGNWFDDLAKGVAGSSAVSQAFDTISTSIVKAFGGTSQTLLQTLLGWVDKFANAVTRVGPLVINAIASIKNTIVDIWNQLVAFNDRWQITNNLIVGAKVAWSVLRGAFDLVKIAVQAVIKAWSEMPDWLQRITRTALEGTLALGAYSVAIGATATPLRALIGSVDLGINIIGNLTGAIYTSIFLWPKLTTQVTLANAAFHRHVIALRMTTVASNIEIFTTKSVALAKMTLAAATNVATYAFTALSARLGLATAALYLHLTATTLLTTAKGLWASAVSLVTFAYTGLITRLGIATIALKASTVATYAGLAAMEAFGFVILGIQALPLIAALTALAVAVMKVYDAWKDLQQAHSEGRTTWEFLTAKDNDNWLRRWLGLSTAIDGVTESIKRLKKGGVSSTAGEFAPTISPGYLATGSAEMQAARAAREREELARQGIGLGDTPETALVVDTAAEKVKSLLKSWNEATLASSVFRSAFTSLSAEQRKNFEIQQQLVPEIHKLIAAQQPLTSGMREVLVAEQARRLGLLESNRLTLEASDLTLTSVDAMKRVGMTEADIALAYGVTTDALGRRMTALQEAATRQEANAAFEHELVEQQLRDSERRQQQELKANQAVGEAREELDDLTRQRSMTTTQYQIQKIREESAARIAAFSATGAPAQAVKNYTALVIALSDKRIDALMVDEDALRNYSKRTLEEIAQKARNTYLVMAEHPEVYSRKTIEHFKRIAEEAERAASGTRDAWEDVYRGLSLTAEALDAIPNKYAKIAAEAIDSAQRIMKAYEEGGAVNAILTAAVEGVKWVAKLFGAGPTDYEKRTRAAAAEMKSLTAEAVKAAGSMERLALNARMVGIHIKGAFDSGDPEFLNQILGEMNDKTQKLTAAMEEYGFTWEDMGADYRGAQLADRFDELFEKTQLLKGAGIDYATILERQAEDYSSLVQAAIRSGTEIPLSMQPVLQDLVNMGKLVDENGVAFDDLSDISWAKTMTQGFEDVTTAIYDLRDALVGGVGSALDDISRRVVTPRIKPIWEGPGEDDELEVVEPSYFAKGGNVVAFRPQGTDTVPAMLTPGERVIPKGAEGGRVVVELNGRWLAETVVPEIPGAVKRLGVGR